ncbi:DUF4157 domain-containing protein [Chloroflexota bacterium]
MSLSTAGGGKMAEGERVPQSKREEVDQKHRTRQQDSEPLFDQLHVFDQFHAWEQDGLSLGDTPFRPPMDRHAALLSQAKSDQHRANLVLRLQRTYGNTYVQRLLGSMAIQAKVAINPPNDIYEQEADRVAKVVTRTTDSQLHRQPEEEEEEVQAQSAQAKPAPVSEDLEKRINDAKGGGQPLAERIREPMEEAFGADFSDVRVHTDLEADELNQQLSAKAFTTDQDVFFRQGEYSPSSDTGRKLLAHELTHVVQQGGRKHYQRRTNTGSEAATIVRRSQPRIVQKKIPDFLVPATWISESKKFWYERSEPLRQIDLAVSKYDLAKRTHKSVDEQIKCLEDINTKIADWKESKGEAAEGEAEPWVLSKRFEAIEGLIRTVGGRLDALKREKRTQEVYQEIARIYGPFPEGLTERIDTLFLGYRQWCRAKNIKYNTKATRDPLEEGTSGKSTSCEFFCRGLQAVLIAAGVQNAKVRAINRTNFVTKGLTGFIDQDCSGNVKLANQQYNGKRFFFSNHWIVDVGGQTWDPTAGQDPQFNEELTGFKLEDVLFPGGSKPKKAYVKGNYVLEVITNGVDFGDGYELWQKNAKGQLVQPERFPGE